MTTHEEFVLLTKKIYFGHSFLVDNLDITALWK